MLQLQSGLLSVVVSSFYTCIFCYLLKIALKVRHLDLCWLLSICLLPTEDSNYTASLLLICACFLGKTAIYYTAWRLYILCLLSTEDSKYTAPLLYVLYLLSAIRLYTACLAFCTFCFCYLLKIAIAPPHFCTFCAWYLRKIAITLPRLLYIVLAIYWR